MAELNDSSELQKYSQAVLYILSAVPPPPEYVELIADNFLAAITSSTVNFNSLKIKIVNANRKNVLVMAYSTECIAHILGLLLPEPHEHVEYDHIAGHGGPPRLSFG